MDAQNAAQSDQTKPAGASLQRPGPGPDAPSTHASVPAPVTSKFASPVKHFRDRDAITDPAGDAFGDRDSDAETIVLPGKDGHSPSKVRKVRQEDRSDGDGDFAAPATTAAAAAAAVMNTTAASAAATRPRLHDAERLAPAGSGRSGDGVNKRKLLSGHIDRDRRPRNKDPSSGLSSAPASPPLNQHQHRRRSHDFPSSSDSEYPHHQPSSSKVSLREKLKSGERVLHKRKASKPDTDDEADTRKARRQRTTSAGIEPGAGRPHRDHKSVVSSGRPHNDSRNRSPSPHGRTHRRSVSTQLPSQSSNGFGQKKKRLPPPLQATDYHSDESSASGSPHPRSSKLRSLTTPATADLNASPAKMAPHKKHLDAHGQTFLARACARCEYDVAKYRLGERPEDLNVADYAGNTPLQIAAINGCVDIVKLLIDAGCNLDCVNYDKDTPLLDAVDNGHLGVVKLLLDAGVNPRKANVNGEEPIDRVSDDTENAQEIRAALIEARKRAGDRRRTSEDHHSHNEYHDARNSHAPDSPRHSPAANAAATGRRSGTVRSTKTRNDLLYTALDDKTLRSAAGKGDEATVARILQVKEGHYDDPESMVAAARGGHDLVIQLLLGIGGANPDPAPVSSLPSAFATPILAAIGQENIKVLELLLEQQSFDPTKRIEGQTYYEIARNRLGPHWKEEETILKNAYDEYKRTHKDLANKTKSPRRERDRERERQDREMKRVRRGETKDEARPPKRTHSSPSRDPESRKGLAHPKLSSPKKQRSDSFTNQGDDHPPKRAIGRSKKEEKISPVIVSDREVSPTMSHKQPKPRRAEPDAAAMSSEGETVKPRRKLVSKGELRGEREKQRRASMASAASLKDPPSPHETRNDETSDKHRADKLSEKYHDRTKALKRDESRDRLSVTGDGSAKRHRNSVTPDRPNSGEKDESEAPVKRRRLDGEGQEKRTKHASSDERPRKSNKSHDASNKHPPKETLRSHDGERQEAHPKLQRRESGRSSGSDRSIHVKSEELDVDMQDAVSLDPTEETAARASREKEEQERDRIRKRKLAEQEQAKKKEEERKQAEAEERKRKEQEEARRREEEAKKRKEEEEQEAERKRKEEADRLRREEERKRREVEEKARRDEEERRKVEEERKKKEEEERQKREEEERLQREELERQAAADEARRQREEEERRENERKEYERKENERKENERKENERKERAYREEVEKKRAAREAEEKRRIQAEEERLRLEKLPPLLRWLETCHDPCLTAYAEKFKVIQGVRFDTIQPEMNHTPEGREQWVLNTHVALLLGEKDLDLSRCKSWDPTILMILF